MARTVLITGCSSGIGKQLAITLHRRGYQVIATGRKLEKLEPLAQQGIMTLALDVTAQNSIDAAISSIQQQGLSIDILVNNAGYGAMAPAAELSEAALHQQFATNVYGPMNLVRACVPMMHSKRSGLIVNIGSVSGVLVTPFSGAYCATKAAIHALSDALRMELAPFNIEVMVVMPGAIESEFGNAAEAMLPQLLKQDSIYDWARDGIYKRAQASQSIPTPTVKFVDQLVAALEQKTTPPVIAIGKGSLSFRLIARLVPIRIRDKILCRAFGLSQKAAAKQ
jgi:short-subunit dehydrogenase